MACQHFGKMIELEKIMLVASGPAVLKEKITNSLRQNSRKFGVNFSLLFIKCESSKFGVEPPSASYSNGDLKLTFYPEHPFYGNVAQNWTLLREKTILLAKKMIKNNLTFNLSSLWSYKYHMSAHAGAAWADSFLALCVNKNSE